MAAFGGRAALNQRAGGFELAVVSDALFTETSSEAAAGLAAGSGSTSRVRLALEGSGSIALRGGAELRPTLEAGLRRDGGDAETGAGVELGGGLAYAFGRLAVEVRARALAAHEDENYEEWGFRGSVLWQPEADGRGLSARLGSTRGRAAGGVDALWGRPDAAGLTRGAGMDAGHRFEAEFGYGLETRGGRALWTPLVAGEAGGGARSLRLGLKFAAGTRAEAALEIGQRRFGILPPEDALGLRIEARW